ncbi:efflux RND transporter permease subunit [Candidatus Methylospira mobilis]|uniref:Efflux RND transporter permease subunit n=1 Tax=Candidatus Methylospira mobilis TaxID=1808979 RepID=A0A5Q0BKA9_9GAMM|nr:CusA/CzcA family heavy metal efflux RND transporter [Candidatus Methylospira mobilis]QFY42644.1 efflux RND transporter permease subunit [Candidatus Methylospira mobilis]WNV04240.1 CusA/CzcA family heavy metal efflux RND transporter [Candidatus Methylospira mobilis]
MIARIIAFCLKQRGLVIAGAIVLAIAGVLSFQQLPVQAFPDVQNVYVQVVTQYPGQAPEEVEKLITLPLEKGMSGIPHLINLRSVSIFGLSVLTLTFDDNAKDYFSRQLVLERLRSIDLPDGVDSELGPLSTGIGEIYRYRIEAPPEVSLPELRALQDWVIERRLRTIQGVADVVPFGGGIKQYQVQVDPGKLKNYGLGLRDVFQAIADNNANTGGGYIEHGYEALVVRGSGLLKSTDDIGNIVVSSNEGSPILIKNLAEVTIGTQPRVGMVGFDQHDDIVEGVVLLLKGGDAVGVLSGVKQKIEELNDHELPQGIKIVPFYDRTELVRHTVHTVEHNMIEGTLLIFVILLIFLRKFTASMVVLAVIPLSLMFAFILISSSNISANLISLGAIDFGIIVDGAIVLVEAIMVKVTWEMAHKARIQQMRQSLLITAAEMGRPMLFSQAIIITAFLPIFTFQRVEAKIFSPMAFTFSFALLGSLVVSLTLVPVLMSYLLGPRLVESHNTLVEWMERRYRVVLEVCLHNPRKLLGAALTALFMVLGSTYFIGTEFMPKLDEGNIWLTITLPTPVSLTKAKELERSIRQHLTQFQEANSILTQLGRPEDGTDPKGFNNLEIMIDLKPKETWRFKHKDDMIVAMQKSLSDFPGIQFNFSQVIQDNVEEAISGVKGEIAIKIFGSDLKVLQDKANQITHILHTIRGATDIAAEQQSGLAQILIEIDRAAIARYGLNISDVEDNIEMAIGGKAATTLLEGERRFDVAVRLQEDARDSESVIENLMIPLPNDGFIPLAQLAHIKVDQGASRITREDHTRRIAIKCNLIGRDQGSFVAEAQQRVAKEVSLPAGYRIIWSGQFENQQRAMKRLAVIVPTSILLIFVLLFWAFNSVRNALLILMNVPFALIGGFIALFLTKIHLSISASVGFIALFGIAVQNGVILLSKIKQCRQEGLELDEAIRHGSISRLRPVIMTATIALLGLLPAAVSTGVGSETAKPFAVVIVGGLITSTLLTLTLLPTFYGAFEPSLIKEEEEEDGS